MAGSASTSAPQAQGDLVPNSYLYGPNNASGSATNDYNMNFDNRQQPHQPGYYHQNYQQAGSNGQFVLEDGTAAQSTYVQPLPSQEEHIQEEEEEEEEEPQQQQPRQNRTSQQVNTNLHNPNLPTSHNSVGFLRTVLDSRTEILLSSTGQPELARSKRGSGWPSGNRHSMVLAGQKVEGKIDSVWCGLARGQQLKTAQHSTGWPKGSRWKQAQYSTSWPESRQRNKFSVAMAGQEVARETGDSGG
ncbi:hypothetical protein FIBSPDRAFT_886606 [Athelia psychrophila]|uniref:Uncharacterized protein n=1 Tax=Athelia psychrophila TaxID=1759441 RepID=A0A166QNP0_9AGAM|nr:hypothetical protein FIBSPDRAFT_886606 [Fibularhizoctonia sp. CBS 109695]